MTQKMDILITDECPDHHFDIHILPWSKVTISFGSQCDDIPINSQFLGKMNQSNDSTQCKKSLHGDFTSDNIEFLSTFISFMITHQCLRYDTSFFDVIQLQQRDDGYNSPSKDWDTYFEETKEWIKSVLFYNNEHKHINKQLIIMQYAPNNQFQDNTNLQLYEIQDIISNLSTKDGIAMELLDKFKNNDGCPLIKLTRFLNKIENVDINDEKEINKKPLFIHHFYPSNIIFYETLSEVLNVIFDGIDNDIIIPQEIVNDIVDFTVSTDNGMYYDVWYLQRNAKKSNNQIINLWDDLLFDQKYYEYTKQNKYNGLIDKVWIPSIYLLENKEDCLQKIINELRENNVFHIYRQIIWSILLCINNRNDLFDHNTDHIKQFSVNWMDEHNLCNIYKDILKLEEWNDIYFHGGTKYTMLSPMMYVFGGNIFNALYGFNRMILINEYEINGGMMSRFSGYFKSKMDERMDIIYSILCPIIYKTLKELVSSIFIDNEEEEFKIYDLFNPNCFDPLIKCYLIELMFFDGIDGLVLTFAAYLNLYSIELISIFAKMKGVDDPHDMDKLAKIAQKLYKFKDVKSMAKLYNTFRNEIMQKHSDKIQLQKNPFIMQIDYTFKPNYWTSITLSDDHN